MLAQPKLNPTPPNPTSQHHQRSKSTHTDCIIQLTYTYRLYDTVERSITECDTPTQSHVKLLLEQRRPEPNSPQPPPLNNQLRSAGNDQARRHSMAPISVEEAPSEPQPTPQPAAAA